jgi:hypothetical protein
MQMMQVEKYFAHVLTKAAGMISSYSKTAGFI